jgi:glyoxylate utilization-related uncharacterized protein
MAKKLDTFPDNGRQGVSRYNWGEWLDGGAWELESGKDFVVPSRSFRSAAAQAARAKDGYIKTKLIKVEGQDDPNVIIQFRQEKDEPHSATAEDMTEDSSLMDDETS